MLARTQLTPSSRPESTASSRAGTDLEGAKVTAVTAQTPTRRTRFVITTRANCRNLLFSREQWANRDPKERPRPKMINSNYLNKVQISFILAWINASSTWIWLHDFLSQVRIDFLHSGFIRVPRCSSSSSALGTNIKGRGSAGWCIRRKLPGLLIQRRVFYVFKLAGRTWN